LLTSGIETNVAYGTCLFLFALLVLLVRKRKMLDRTPHTFYPAPLRAKARPTPGNKPPQRLRRATTRPQPSGLLLNKGLAITPIQRANTKAPAIAANRLAEPIEFPALSNSHEVKMDSAPLPFEHPDPVAPAEISALAGRATPPALPENIPASPAPQIHAEIEEQLSQEIAIATHPHAAAESHSETRDVVERGVAEKCGAEQIALQEFVMGAPAPIANAAPQKRAGTDVLSYYGLPQQPFDVTPDPAYLYFTPSHREALASLKEGIGNFRGFMVLVAEPGMGKTTLMNKLMEEVADSARVVFLFQTQCSSHELLCFILNELEVDHAGMDVVAMHRALNQALLEEMLRGRRFVLVVDEAQNLQEPVLETIRLLSDFETTHSKLIQIVLAGQPQLAETLMKPTLVQLRQRISVLSSLKSLSAEETSEYVEHRLLASGWGGTLLFTPEALAQIAESSAGVPRSINNLCFNALLAGFHRGLEVIDAGIVREVVEKLNLESLVRRSQMDANSQRSAASEEAIAATQLARALATALHAEARPDANSENFIGPNTKPEVVLTGNLTEKVRSQGWSKRPEYRIMVTLERDPVSGLPVAERYYCCSIYVDELQAAGLQTGRPVRIKIEQD
jgi:general secretion pathway protein A